MNPSAVESARSRFRKAVKAADEFRKATSFDEADDAWTDFLLACAAIYSKLEQGAKGDNRSSPWFGKLKRLRRTDPLLRYLHFARNSDEHGIEPVTKRDFGGSYKRELKFNEKINMKVQKVDQITLKAVGDPIDAVISGPTIKLVKVVDRRFNDFCEPPDKHLGNKLPYGETFIEPLLDAGLLYFENVLKEADELAL